MRLKIHTRCELVAQHAIRRCAKEVELSTLHNLKDALIQNSLCLIFTTEKFKVSGPAVTNHWATTALIPSKIHKGKQRFYFLRKLHRFKAGTAVTVLWPLYRVLWLLQFSVWVVVCLFKTGIYWMIHLTSSSWSTPLRTPL